MPSWRIVVPISLNQLKLELDTAGSKFLGARGVVGGIKTLSHISYCVAI